MDVVRQFTNRCACGWEFRGPRDAVVDATIDHAERLHNMTATRDEVLAGLDADDGDEDESVGADAEGTPVVAAGPTTEATAG